MTIRQTRSRIGPTMRVVAGIVVLLIVTIVGLQMRRYWAWKSASIELCHAFQLLHEHGEGSAAALSVPQSTAPIEYHGHLLNCPVCNAPFVWQGRPPVGGELAISQTDRAQARRFYASCSSAHGDGSRFFLFESATALRQSDNLVSWYYQVELNSLGADERRIEDDFRLRQHLAPVGSDE